MKACIIGISGYGRRVHYNLLLSAQAAGQVEIVGATVINQDEEAKKCARLRELGCTIYGDYIESADTASMLIETDAGIPIRFYATHACRKQFGPEIHIQGTKGSIVMTHSGSAIAPDSGNCINRVRCSMLDVQIFGYFVIRHFPDGENHLDAFA